MFSNKIQEIESFVNDAIENINKSKSFKVHDLSINEKVKPLRSFLGHILNSDKPPKATINSEILNPKKPLK